MADLKRGIKWLLFLSSYAPLYVILVFKHWGFTITVPEVTIPIIQQLSGESIPLLSIGWILLSVISLAALITVIGVRRSKGGGDFKNVDSYQSRDELVTTYILVYIFPFVVLDFSEIMNWIAFIIFFLVIGIIQVRSSHLHVNPVLSLIGYRVYEIETGEKTVLLVADYELDESIENVRTVELSNDVHMAV